MKGIKLFFVGCLGLLVFQATIAADSDDTVRAAVRRDTTVTTTARQKSGTTTQSAKQNSRGGGRTTTVSTSPAARERATKNPGRMAANVTPRTTTSRTVSERNQTTGNVVTRAPKTTVPATTARTAARTAITGTRTATTRKATKSGARKSRATTSVGITGAISTNYANCRKTYYDCMDEFCANKDSQLRRCSCSSRAHEFDGAQKQLSRIEEKMLDFNQRLLTVNLDAEDVDAMLNSTEGEDAYYDTNDKTKSRKMLNDISQRLNKTFGEDSTNGMGAISLSLNADSAFDTINSLGGIDTTTKNGVELYRAALPVCREMVLETCSAEELSLAESGYQMQIEQDCNTVSKSYQSQTEQARAKVLESSALLDISRLDAHKKRNSDDVLTCKKKMLDMLTDTTVCGESMSKCLDITGQYIDPTTGQAFLTENLSNLSTLITRPAPGETWVKLSANKTFVDFITDKKNYLKPAMENCQDIADTVWDEFLPDALAQIKLAQDAKLEEIRQACTTLVSECLVETNESITNFDARALSVFGVSADLTANTMCSNVKNACTKLLSTNITTDTNETASSEWGAGISDIATEKTFETILSSCTQVGQNCIIQTCKSVSGNFGLCNDVSTSPNRHSILTRSACWADVKQCVADAGQAAIRNIMVLKGKDSPTDNDFYNIGSNGIYDEYYLPEQSQQQNPPTDDDLYSLCRSDCDANNFDLVKCGTCRLAERIWGNCQGSSSSASQSATNYILVPATGNETLLHWFAKNTGTQNSNQACKNLRCALHMYTPGGEGACIDGSTDNDQLTSQDRRYCPTDGAQSAENSQLYYTPTSAGLYGTDLDNYENIFFFRYNRNQNCCWSLKTRNATSITDPYNTNETYVGYNTCCKGRVGKLAFGQNYDRDTPSICLPEDTGYRWRELGHTPQNNNSEFTAIFCVSNNQRNSYFCENTQPDPTMMPLSQNICSDAYNTAISNTTNPIYPHGTIVRCHGTLVKLTLQNGQYHYDVLNQSASSSSAISGAPKLQFEEQTGLIQYVNAEQ